MQIKLLTIFSLALIMLFGSGYSYASCSLNPDSKSKCGQPLLKFYEIVIKRWRLDSSNEDSALSSKYWPENPACLSTRVSHIDCPYVGDIYVDMTELPQTQASSKTYAATISACSGASGSSCHLYHRVYLILETVNVEGRRVVTICDQVSCP